MVRRLWWVSSELKESKSRLWSGIMGVSYGRVKIIIEPQREKTNNVDSDQV